MDDYYYPYSLGCHLKTGKLCRIKLLMSGKIERGCVRVLRYRKKIFGRTYSPYLGDGSLKPEYWSIHRAQDLNRG